MIPGFADNETVSLRPVASGSDAISGMDRVMSRRRALPRARVHDRRRTETCAEEH